MAKKTAPLLPATERRLERLGDRLRMARLRRRLQAKQVAERAGMSRMTLRQIERGASGVTIGAYVAVMQVLGLDENLEALALDDTLGHRLQDSRLVERVRPEAGGEQADALARPRANRSPEGDEPTPPGPDDAARPGHEAPDGFVSSEDLARELFADLRDPTESGS